MLCFHHNSQVFQRRMDGSVDFFRNWANYKLGFGSARGEHWLGNDNIHVLTNIHENNQLRIDLEAHTNERAFAQYGNFSIASEADDYRMFVDNYLVSSTVTGMKSRKTFAHWIQRTCTCNTDFAHLSTGKLWWRVTQKSNFYYIGCNYGQFLVRGCL